MGEVSWLNARGRRDPDAPSAPTEDQLQLEVWLPVLAVSLTWLALLFAAFA